MMFKQHIPGSLFLISERENWSYPTYLIERGGNSLKAVKNGEITLKLSVEEEKEMSAGKIRLVVIMVGIMSALTILAGGVWLIRKVLKKG